MGVAVPRVAILGAGPIGLDAALASAERGWPFRIYEASPDVAGHVREWGHVRLFSPWGMDLSDRMRRGLEEGPGAPKEREACPTGEELVQRALEPLAGVPAVARALRLGTRVLSVGREGLLKQEEIGTPARRERSFRLLLATPGGEERVETADVVLDCTGAYSVKNALGDGGIPAPGERDLEGRISRRLPDLRSEAGKWAGRRILLVGGGHSAQTAARDLATLAREAPGSRILWVLRGVEPGPAPLPGDPLPERRRLALSVRDLLEDEAGPLKARFGVVVDALRPRGEAVEATLRSASGERESVEVDRVLGLTGAVGDHLLYRQLQVHECYATSGPMKLSAALLADGAGNCLAREAHGVETLLNPEPGFFLLGAKSYGRNPDFLLRIGFAQVDEVFAHLEARAADPA